MEPDRLAFAANVLERTPSTFPGLLGGGTVDPVAIPRLAACLLALGYETDWSQGTNPDTFTGDIAMAVRRFRERSDVHEPERTTPSQLRDEADRFVGSTTWEALNRMALEAVRGAGPGADPAPLEQTPPPATGARSSEASPVAAAGLADAGVDTNPAGGGATSSSAPSSSSSPAASVPVEYLNVEGLRAELEAGGVQVEGSRAELEAAVQDLRGGGTPASSSASSTPPDAGEGTTTGQRAAGDETRTPLPV
jgi:hypothetical protein